MLREVYIVMAGPGWRVWICLEGVVLGWRGWLLLEKLAFVGRTGLRCCLGDSGERGLLRMFQGVITVNFSIVSF